jgi:hypothetical protein
MVPCVVHCHGAASWLKGQSAVRGLLHVYMDLCELRRMDRRVMRDACKHYCRHLTPLRLRSIPREPVPRWNKPREYLGDPVTSPPIPRNLSRIPWSVRLFPHTSLPIPRNLSRIPWSLQLFPHIQHSGKQQQQADISRKQSGKCT